MYVLYTSANILKQATYSPNGIQSQSKQSLVVFCTLCDQISESPDSRRALQQSYAAYISYVEFYTLLFLIETFQTFVFLIWI